VRARGPGAERFGSGHVNGHQLSELTAAGSRPSQERSLPPPQSQSEIRGHPRYLDLKSARFTCNGQWARQQASRWLGAGIMSGREATLRRFQVFTGLWPWQWNRAHVEEWTVSGGWAHSTVRSYQGVVALFLEYVCDPRDGWMGECQQRVGTVPVQICHEWNTATHVADYEGRPHRRPLSRVELQILFDAADDRAEQVAACGRKGWLTAFRDATLVKVLYGWGLRRQEAVMLDVNDFVLNPAAPQLGRSGQRHRGRTPSPA